MVLDAGRIVSPFSSRDQLDAHFVLKVEFDAPSELLKDEKSYFRALVDESGDKEKLVAMLKQ